MTKTTQNAVHFKPGEWVRVRSLAEILRTLDADGKREGLLFMPEMARCCGQQFRVHRRAERTCVEGVGLRKMESTVLLEGLRCDGSLHEGCQRGCLYFWKEAWLQPASRASGRDAIPELPVLASTSAEVGRATPACESAATHLPTTKDGRYYCQSTELHGATAEFSQGKLSGYLHDLFTGEMPARRLVRVLWRAACNRVQRLLHRGPYGQLYGRQTSPSKGDLDLQGGEWVEVKSAAEILATLDADGKNCGLSFEIEMLDYAGQRFRVAHPLRKIILEQSGRMAELTHTVILEGLVCQGLCARNCPRNNLLYWRECWLRRVPPGEVKEESSVS